MKQTTNYKLNKPDTTDTVDIEYLNVNMDTVDAALNDINNKADKAFQQASDGKTKIKTAITGVDPSVTIPTDATFQDLATCISKIKTGIDTADATAKAEQILTGMTAYVSGKKLTGTMVNRGTVTVSLDAGNSYTIPVGYHNGSGKVTANSLDFQTQATAIEEEILSGRTAYINGDKVTGTMPNNGAVGSAMNAGSSYTIPEGYHNGSGKVTANTLASQTSATAVASDVLSGKTVWANGSKITGTIPVLATSWNGNNGGDANAFNDTTMIAGNASGTIDTNEYVAGIDIKIKQGYNGGGTQRFHLPNLLPQNIKAGTKVGFTNGCLQGTFTADATAFDGAILASKTAYVNGTKVTGTMTDRSGGDSEALYAGYASGRIYVRPQAGYWNGVALSYKADANFVAGNILSGVSIFGLTGTGKRVLTGTVTCGGSRYNTIRTGFQPSKVVFYKVPIVKDAQGKDYASAIFWDNSINPDMVYSMAYSWQYTNSIGGTIGSYSESAYNSALRFNQGQEALSSGFTFVDSTGVCLPNMHDFGCMWFTHNTDYFMYYVIAE